MIICIESVFILFRQNSFPNLCVSLDKMSLIESEGTITKKYSARDTELSAKLRRSSHLFNLHSSSDDEQPARKTFKSNQIHAVQKEIAEWSDYIAAKKNVALKFNNKKTIDESILNKEQALFFESAIDCVKWSQQSYEFRRNGKFNLASKEMVAKAAKNAEGKIIYKIEKIPNAMFNSRARFINIEKP